MNDKPGWEAQYQIDTLRADLAKAQAESEAAAKRWDEENASLAAQIAKAQARCAELEAFAERVNGYLLRRYPHDHDCGVKFASSCDCDSNRERVVLLEVLPERDGNSALAAVRLAQRLTRLLRRGGNLYDLPEQVEKALTEAFGSGE